MIEDNGLKEKKLRGSGGYTYAKVTEEEQKRGNLGGPELFIAGIGRLEQNRFSKYYCNKCEREYEGSPEINYENPNEELGEGVTLIEKGEYNCRACSNTLAQYRKFETPVTPETVKPSTPKPIESPPYKKDEASSANLLQQSGDTNASASASVDKTTMLANRVGFIPIQSLVGMPAYDSEATLVGRVKEIGLRRSLEGTVQISIKIERHDNNNDVSTSIEDEVLWNNISKIGDIVLLTYRITNTGTTDSTPPPSTKRTVNCRSCGYQNQENAAFCEECGTKLI
jgi:sporulation protein YlmC with PRC-barrel domain